MDLPQNKIPTKVIYEYDDEKYEITGEDVKNYQDNIESASIMTIMHHGGFKQINWKKYEEKN